MIAAVSMGLVVGARAGAARSHRLAVELFAISASAVALVVAVIGMLAFLGTAYATSIRLGPVQHQSPLRTAVPFLLLQGPAFVLIPLTSWLLERVNPRWVLGSGLAIMAVGQFLAAGLRVGDTALTSLVVPIGLVGVGFALSVCSITATAVNTAPIHFAGMASATTSLLRDFGFTLGPALVGAVALSRAAADFSARLPTGRVSDDQVAAAGRSPARAARSPSTACPRAPPARRHTRWPSTRSATATRSATSCAASARPRRPS